MIFLRATSLRFRLFALVIVTMLPVLGLMLFNASVERDRKFRQLEEEAERMAELAAGSVGKVIEGTHQMLLSMAYAEPVRSLNISATNAFFEELLEKSASHINFGLAQSDGVVIASAIPVKRSVCIAERPWFSRLQQTRGFSIGEFQIGSITGKPTLNVAFPLPNQSEQKPMAAVFAALKLDALQDCISLPQLPPGAILLAVDRNGTYLARNPSFGASIGTKSHSWMALQARGGGLGGFVEAAGVDGIERMYHYAPVPGTENSLFVAVGFSKAVVQTETRTNFLQNLLSLFIATLIALLWAWYAADRSIIRHVRRLTEASQKLADGDWDIQAKVDCGALEFQQLGQTFDQMASALKRHQDDLANLVKERTAKLTCANRTLSKEIIERKQAEAEQERLIKELQDALAHVKTLSGLLPICARCKNIRDDQGYWSQIESYICEHYEAQFSHGLCPDCAKKLFPEYKGEVEKLG